MTKLILIGIILLFISIILIFIGSLSEKSNTKIAAAGFIGPIPFGFFSDKKMFYVLVAVIVFLYIISRFLNL